MKSGAFTSMDALENAFKKNKHGHFTLYNGTSKKSDSWLYRNEDEDNVDAAWDLLQEQIEWRAANGGVFTIFQKMDKGNGNLGFTHVLEMPNPMRGSTAAVSGTQVGGINMMDHLNMAVDNVRKDMMLDRLQEKLDEQEDMIKELQKGNGINSWLQTILTPEAVAPLLQGIGMHFMSRMNGNAGMAGQGIHGAGFPPPHTTPAMHENEPDEIELSEEATDAIIDLQTTLGGQFDEMLKMLAWYIRTNPQMVPSLVGMIKPGYDAAIANHQA